MLRGCAAAPTGWPTRSAWNIEELSRGLKVPDKSASREFPFSRERNSVRYF